MGTMWVMPFFQVAFVPGRNVAVPALLPDPLAHIFYHRRVADARDNLPKYSGYWASEFAATSMLLRGAVAQHSDTPG